MLKASGLPRLWRHLGAGLCWSLLVQEGLEIPIEVTVEWQNRRAMDILQAKVDEVGYPLGDSDRYIDQSKDILKSILNDDVSSDSDGEVDDV